MKTFWLPELKFLDRIQIFKIDANFLKTFIWIYHVKKHSNCLVIVHIVEIELNTIYHI